MVEFEEIAHYRRRLLCLCFAAWRSATIERLQLDELVRFRVWFNLWKKRHRKQIRKYHRAAIGERFHHLAMMYQFLTRLRQHSSRMKQKRRGESMLKSDPNSHQTMDDHLLATNEFQRRMCWNKLKRRTAHFVKHVQRRHDVETKTSYFSMLRLKRKGLRALAAYKLRRRASQQYQGISERSISLWNGFHSLCNSLLRSKQARMLVVRDQELASKYARYRSCRSGFLAIRKHREDCAALRCRVSSCDASYSTTSKNRALMHLLKHVKWRWEQHVRSLSVAALWEEAVSRQRRRKCSALLDIWRDHARRKVLIRRKAERYVRLRCLGAAMLQIRALIVRAREARRSMMYGDFFLSQHMLKQGWVALENQVRCSREEFIRSARGVLLWKYRRLLVATKQFSSFTDISKQRRDMLTQANVNHTVLVKKGICRALLLAYERETSGLEDAASKRCLLRRCLQVWKTSSPSKPRQSSKAFKPPTSQIEPSKLRQVSRADSRTIDPRSKPRNRLANTLTCEEGAPNGSVEQRALLAKDILVVVSQLRLMQQQGVR